MAEDTWKCSKCGQLYPLSQNSCPICFITRENRTVIGKASVARFDKPPPEKVEVPYPFIIKEARFNLPLDRGAVWSSGRVMVTEAGLFLLSEKDPVDADALAAHPPAAAGTVGPLSLYIPREKISRILHHRLTGEFIEIGGKQKIPLRLSSSGWTDLDVLCDQLGIARS
ncbi:MAG TPA: hypothetical protein VG457_01580 [Planctomycetota bacterium]|nr:hypothetical protein [Planctomycetota bacterium]